MYENYKKAAFIGVLVAAVFLSVFFFFGGWGDVSSDRGAADEVRANIQSAQTEADRAGDSLREAEESNRNAQKTAVSIADSNEQLAGLSDSIEHLIDEGERIISEIRGGAGSGEE